MVVFHVVAQDGRGVLTTSITSAALQGLLAQRLAQGTHNPWVLGSNPGGPTSFLTGQAICLVCFLFHSSGFHLQITCLLISGRPRSAACDDAATKPAHLLRLAPTPRPYPVFLENRRPSTCGFIFARDAMVGGCGPNVVDGPHPWREVPGGGRAGAGKEGGGHAAARGARPAGNFGHRVPLRPRARSARRRIFSKIVLASAGEFPYSTSSHGGVAQLGERLTGSQEVRGSIPLVSTRALNEAPTQVGAFFHIGTQGQRRHHDPPGRQDRKKLRRARPL